MSEKLPSFAKILLATGAINYMAASIESANEQIKTIPDPEGVHKDGIEERDELLFETWGKLAEIMEDMGNLINAHDMLCPIDIRATAAAFDILVHNNDDVTK